jgi:hypothetical protein
MPAGTIDICAWTGLVGDINSSNDTILECYNYSFYL